MSSSRTEKRNAKEAEVIAGAVVITRNEFAKWLITAQPGSEITYLTAQPGVAGGDQCPRAIEVIVDMARDAYLADTIELVDETILYAGDYTEVKPGDYHQFFAVGDEMAVIFEVYFANFQHEDIERESVGGHGNHA